MVNAAARRINDRMKLTPRGGMYEQMAASMNRIAQPSDGIPKKSTKIGEPNFRPGNAKTKVEYASSERGIGIQAPSRVSAIIRGTRRTFDSFSS